MSAPARSGAKERPRTIWRSVFTIALVLAGNGCGVPKNKSVQPIEPKLIPFGLAATSTTSTTTTTTTTQAPPPTEPPPTVPVPTAAPTTVAPVDSVALVFVFGDALVETRRALPAIASVADVVALLAAGPADAEVRDGLRTAIEAGDVASVTLKAGTVTIDLAPKFRDLPSAEQSRSVAQLVLTLTSRPGVGQVTFTIDGQPFDTPRSDGSFGGATVSRDDYADLLG